eukprot:CAMPEP_0180564908 /NCGR_PEP_ID=MMETSP1037_2-20121125/5258_1 /TAXON_ID=632150 /ORGANISM="Azadinium spinosum, Strain 3D9" /LENGTH=92 /DNA_ID=CAMNT_0022581833 /DNA_START=1 /DNA_END=276 /DNA_ORIENTATION=+
MFRIIIVVGGLSWEAASPPLRARGRRFVKGLSTFSSPWRPLASSSMMMSNSAPPSSNSETMLLTEPEDHALGKGDLVMPLPADLRLSSKESS